MLENFRTQKIIWDRANKKIFEKIEANSGDSNGRKLVVQVINQGVTEGLSGTTLSLGWKSRKGAKGLDAFNVVDASKGIFEIYYTTEMLSNIGNIEASFILIDSNGRIESSTFTISVRPSTVDDSSVQSENSFTALTEALVKVNDFDAQLAQKANIADLPSSAYTFKGTTTFAALPTTGNTLGDVRYTTDNLQNYAWTGTAWTPIGNGAFANGSVTNAKLANGSVSPINTDFLKRGDNILPTGSFILGSLNYNTGVVTESTTEYVTGLLPATEFMNKYIFSANFVKATGYAADGVTFVPNHTWSSIAIGQNRKVQREEVKYIRFGITKANYDHFNGKIMIVATDEIITTMPEYEPFRYRIDNLKVISTDVDGLSDEITNALESSRGEYITSESIKDIARVNLLNKDDMTAGVLISTTTGLETADATYVTSKSIDVRNHVGKHIISNVGSIRVAQFDKDGVFVTGGVGGVTTNRQIIHANTYTIKYSISLNTLRDYGYHERVYNGQYMAIWLGTDTEYTSDQLTNGGEGFELYDERGRVIVTRQPRVLKNHILSNNANLVIYNAYNDLNTSRKYVPRLFIDHLLGLSDDKKITFANGKDYLELPPTTIAGNSTQVVKTDKFKSEKYLLKNPKFNVRTVKSSIGASVVPRVLFIGDSITAGVPQMFDGIGLDTPYWGQVKRLFEMDKVDNGDTGYDIKILGGDTIPFEYNGVTRTLRGGKAAIGGYGLTNFMHHATNVQPSAESWALLGLDVSTGQPYTGTLAQKELIRMTPQHAYPNVGEGQCIPFYDENATGDTTFSVLRYLQRYRTMDDNGVRLTWGDPNIGSYIDSQAELEQYDACTPTHIVLQHGRNDELYPNAFKQSLEQFISVVKAEIPNCKIGICIPPNNGGTIFPDRYPNITNIDKIGLSSSYFVGNSYDLAKIILDTHANREGEGIYLIPNYFVQPTAYSIPLKKSDVMCSLETVYEQAIDEPMVSHPSGEAHKAWAYQVYCWLKYTMI